MANAISPSSFLCVLSVLYGFNFYVPKKKGRDVLTPIARNSEMLFYLPPNPAVCIDCREISAVDAIPCMRSLKSSAFEAFSRAVS